MHTVQDSARDTSQRQHDLAALRHSDTVTTLQRLAALHADADELLTFTAASKARADTWAASDEAVMTQRMDASAAALDRCALVHSQTWFYARG